MAKTRTRKIVRPTDVGSVRMGRLEDLDKRFRGPRLALQRETEVATEHFGGIENLPPIRRSLLRRWVHVEAMATRIELDIVQGRAPDIAAYLSLVDRLHGIGKTLGLDRVVKRVSLADAMSKYERKGGGAS